MEGGSVCPGRSLMTTTLPTIRSAGLLTTIRKSREPGVARDGGNVSSTAAAGGGELNPFASIIPLLASLPGPPETGDKVEAKPLRYLVEKGLPTLPMKLVERVWNLEYVDMDVSDLDLKTKSW